MHTLLAIGIDLALICLLIFGVYFPRHHRRDLVAAFLAVNIGVLAVAMSLSNTNVGIGLGMGLFGVLSIIRLRSTELDQRAVAYYFTSLALGLICGLAATINLTLIALGVLLVLGLAIGDHPRLLRRHRSITMLLDGAIATEAEAITQVSAQLGHPVRAVSIERVNYLNDSTLLTAHFLADDGAAGGAQTSAPARASVRLSA